MKVYNVKITKQASKFLDKNKALEDVFQNWVPLLETEPYSANDGKMTNERYKGFQVYKKRLLIKYRALYVIDDEAKIVEVFKIASRGEVYKK